MSEAARLDRREQVEGAVQDGHVLVRRDDEDLVGRDFHPVVGLKDFHLGIPADQVGHHAFVFGGEVGYKDEGHPRIRRHVLEEVLNRVETAGGRANACYVKGL